MTYVVALSFYNNNIEQAIGSIILDNPLYNIISISASVIYPGYKAIQFINPIHISIRSVIMRFLSNKNFSHFYSFI